VCYAKRKKTSKQNKILLFKKMDTNSEETIQKTPVGLNHRQLVFSFIRAIRGLDADRRLVEAAVANLAEAFQVDPAGIAGVNDANVDLIPVFDEAAAKSKEIDHKDEKFVAFLDLLTKKGYFNGAPEGSEEYKNRLTKAEAKFRAKSNPYEGLDAEQLKNKGNELMQKQSYREAVGFYTKAIELNPENHIYFANRAAAFTHLKDYSSAINDGERSVSINPTYAKAFSRLGTAHFFEGNYQRAVDSFTRALELDPDNENYKTDLQRAKDKLAVSGNAGGGANSPSAFPGFGGMDMNSIMSMMGSPAFQEMANNMMRNPQFMNMIQGMAGQMGMQAPSLEQMESFMKNGPPKVDEQGNFDTPFGKMNRDAMDRMRQQHGNDPKMRAIMEDVQQNGMGAMAKYLGDPEVMGRINEMMRQIQAGGGGNSIANGNNDDSS
jgi:small glutamine-rich tetratricopeptide repeat-containing protein alpha